MRKSSIIPSTKPDYLNFNQHQFIFIFFFSVFQKKNRRRKAIRKPCGRSNFWVIEPRSCVACRVLAACTLVMRSLSSVDDSRWREGLETLREPCEVSYVDGNGFFLSSRSSWGHKPSISHDMTLL